MIGQSRDEQKEERVTLITPMPDRFDDVRRIAVLRGGGLGDVLFVLPAVEALAAAYPGAEIVLLGTPMQAALLDERPGSIDRVEVLPVVPGVRDAAHLAAQLGDHDVVTEDADAFLARQRAVGFDLAVQLHGGGRNSNPFLLALGARHTVGAATDDAPRLERTLPYVYYQHEVMRALEVAALAGAAPVGLEPRLAVTTLERRSVDEFLPTDGRPLAVLHPGASDLRRRWAPDRFARVAEALVADGAALTLVGDAGDRRLASAVLGAVDAATKAAVVDLTGRLTLGRLAALFERAAVVVANDSGPRHLAQAVGAPTVGVFWFGNVVNAAPFTRQRHRVQLSYVTACPVCGVDVTQVGWTAPRCEHDASHVDQVDPAAVIADARAIMATTTPRSGTRAARGSRIPQAG